MAIPSSYYGSLEEAQDYFDGYPLDAGEEVKIPIDDPSKIYVIGSADNQGVKWFAV